MLPSMSFQRKRLASTFILLALSLGLMSRSAAHDIPGEIVIQALAPDSVTLRRSSHC